MTDVCADHVRLGSGVLSSDWRRADHICAQYGVLLAHMATLNFWHSYVAAPIYNK